MATIVEVSKNSHESPTSLLRRFSRRVQEAKIVIRGKKSRYFERAASKEKRKTQALRRIGKRAQIERLKKLGKIGLER